jgi:hypothetical protein
LPLVKLKGNIWLPITLMMIVFALSRWPGLMPQNFSAAYAVAFCAGVYFPPRLRWILPLGTTLVLDILLNRYYDQPFLQVGLWIFILVKLAAFAGIIWIGTWFQKKNSLVSLIGGGILGAIVFYLVTNFASWLYDPAYPKTLAGLFQALTSGVPGLPPTWTFFRNTLLSGGLFTGLFAGAMKLTEAAEEAKEDETDEVPAGEEQPQKSGA